jgi:hypothetical protein
VSTGPEHRVRRIAVVGMGRSGTSFLAQFLAASGVFFEEGGKRSKLEHPEARAINDAIFAERFGARDGLPYGTLPAEEVTVGDPWPGRVRAFAQAMDARAEAADAGSWAVKDPRLTVLHSLWLPEFDAVVAIFRDPFQVVGSYLNKGWIHGPRKSGITLRYWTRFNRSLLAIAAETPADRPLYVLDFNVDMPKQLANLCERLELPRRAEALSLYRATRNEERGRRSPAARNATRLYPELLALRNLL